MSKTMMFKTACPICGKDVFTYGTSRKGQLPVVYCSRACKSEAEYEKRFIDKQRLG
jgi:endogenous inhibitor of DNA gyrase (YacG/DUF329 family)